MSELKRVLVVDDDNEVCDLLRHALRQHDLIVDTASDGREALDQTAQHQYAVIVLDLLMPVLDGFGFLDSLARIDLLVQPVVLVISGADRSVIRRLDPQRIHGLIRKPFDVDEVAALVAACAEIRGRGAFEKMVIAMIAGGPLLALLDQFRM